MAGETQIHDRGTSTVFQILQVIVQQLAELWGILDKLDDTLRLEQHKLQGHIDVGAACPRAGCHPPASMRAIPIYCFEVLKQSFSDVCHRLIALGCVRM